MIVDTNGLSAWWLNESSFIRHIEHADRLCVPVPALAEFRFGILQSKFREKMTAWLEESLTAIARQHKLLVISRDTHFDHVTGLTRIGW